MKKWEIFILALAAVVICSLLAQLYGTHVENEKIVKYGELVIYGLFSVLAAGGIICGWIFFIVLCESGEADPGYWIMGLLVIAGIGLCAAILFKGTIPWMIKNWDLFF